MNLLDESKACFEGDEEALGDHMCARAAPRPSSSGWVLIAFVAFTIILVLLLLLIVALFLPAFKLPLSLLNLDAHLILSPCLRLFLILQWLLLSYKFEASSASAQPPNSHNSHILHLPHLCYLFCLAFLGIKLHTPTLCRGVHASESTELTLGSDWL